MELYGQIDLAVLGDIVRNHPEAVKTFTTKDGKTHKCINITIGERKTPSTYGHTHFLKVGVKKEQQKQGLNYFVGDLKPSQQAEPPKQAQPAPQQMPPKKGDDDLPF